MVVPSQNIIQCFEDIHYDETTKFERPGKMRRTIRSEHSDFLKKIINYNGLNDSPLVNLLKATDKLTHLKQQSENYLLTLHFLRFSIPVGTKF